MVLSPEDVPLGDVLWLPCFRAISSHVSPSTLFERVADPHELDVILELEALTDDRARDERERLSLVPPEDRVTGPGSGFVMGAFMHFPPHPSRFRDTTFGAYYAARERETAIAETAYHRARFLSLTAEAPIEVGMQMLVADLDAVLHDVRGRAAEWPALYDTADYTASMHLGRALRDQRSWGIAYDSVRNSGGECVAVLRPPALSGCRRAELLTYVWDGARIADVRERAGP